LHSNAIDGNQWYMNTNKLSNAVNPTLVPIAKGDYYVIVTLSGCSSLQSNVISFNPTGIVEVGENISISVYPNPTKGKVKIMLNNKFNSDYTVDIYDNIGGLLESVKKNKSETNVDLDLRKYSEGVYMLRIYASDRYYQTKVVKK
jgi:hypothetical protein